MAAIDSLVTLPPLRDDTVGGGEPTVEERSYICDSCGETFAGTPGGSGLFIWTRGDEIRYEEPPLCEACAVAVSTTVMLGGFLDDDGGGEE